MRQPIVSALGALDGEGAHSLIFPCERTEFGWRHAGTEVPVDVHPTHWRDWISAKTVGNDS
ncbi:hypothetical protein FJ974_29185 (plasmid) [Mesorhizobium sp. B1-1-8]|nr:hypothetical protein FJ974_29185 [Mesorhizobium sp. B1-1-8]